MMIFFCKNICDSKKINNTGYSYLSSETHLLRQLLLLWMFIIFVHCRRQTRQYWYCCTSILTQEALFRLLSYQQIRGMGTPRLQSYSSSADVLAFELLKSSQYFECKQYQTFRISTCMISARFDRQSGNPCHFMTCHFNSRNVSIPC